ncbi:MAG: MBL fold metallo-hydrolase [Paracoccaceae bacterium]
MTAPERQTSPPPGGPEVEFVNHASVLVTHGGVGLLSDPWYSGPAFDGGWQLLEETEDERVRDVLSRTTHIWISHEHPDHFSIGFWKRYGDAIRAAGIEVLFQAIEDQRVAKFLRGQRFALTELTFGRAHRIGPDFAVTCLKDEFYDSALSIRAGGRHVLNLNDCAVGDRPRAQEIRDAVGPCDVLLTQFSYAAWKGGRDNRAWREAAAEEKLNNVAVQVAVLEPSVVIPFASFIWFSHEWNGYLNDAANRPQDVIGRLDGTGARVAVLAPGDRLSAHDDRTRAAAIAHWDALIDAVPSREAAPARTVAMDELRARFDAYVARVHAANDARAMRLAQRLSPIRVFQPVGVHLPDLDATVTVDVARGTMVDGGEAHLSMPSGNLAFLFSNSFGFDTLGVNGCFEEVAPGGFARAAKSLAIENLNNLGLRFGPALLFEKRLLAAFFDRLRKVRRHTE